MGKDLGIGLTLLGIGPIELRMGLIELKMGLIELGIGLMELGIGLRINNARRTVLARVTGLVLERAREPDALYFAPGHTRFAGREPGLLSQFWLGIFYPSPFANSGSPRHVCLTIN